MSKIITDNSKVNENLLKTIDNLENTIKKLKEIKERQAKQLSMRVVGSGAITDADLIAFAKWLDDMSYTHRLKIVPKDLTEFYLKNKASILEQYS